MPNSSRRKRRVADGEARSSRRDEARTDQAHVLRGVVVSEACSAGVVVDTQRCGKVSRHVRREGHRDGATGTDRQCRAAGGTNHAEHIRLIAGQSEGCCRSAGIAVKTYWYGAWRDDSRAAKSQRSIARVGHRHDAGGAGGPRSSQWELDAGDRKVHQRRGPRAIQGCSLRAASAAGVIGDGQRHGLQASCGGGVGDGKRATGVGRQQCPAVVGLFEGGDGILVGVDGNDRQRDIAGIGQGQGLRGAVAHLNHPREAEWATGQRGRGIGPVPRERCRLYPAPGRRVVLHRHHTGLKPRRCRGEGHADGAGGPSRQRASAIARRGKGPRGDDGVDGQRSCRTQVGQRQILRSTRSRIGNTQKGERPAGQCNRRRCAGDGRRKIDGKRHAGKRDAVVRIRCGAGDRAIRSRLHRDRGEAGLPRSQVHGKRSAIHRAGRQRGGRNHLERGRHHQPGGSRVLGQRGHRTRSGRSERIVLNIRIRDGDRLLGVLDPEVRVREREAGDRCIHIPNAIRLQNV